MVELPQELTNERRWVCWRWDKDDSGKPTKMPTNAHRNSAANASTTAPATWTTYEHARAKASEWNLPGVGFVFTDSDLVGVDLDHVRDAGTGETVPWALHVIRHLDSYTELSQSGTGYHIIAHGTLPPGRRAGIPPLRQAPEKLEMYDGARGRYFATTSQHVPGTPETVNERTAELAAVHARYFPPKAHKQGAIIKKADTPTLPDDARLLELARNAKNGAKFARLYDAGDTSGHGSDDSAADLALCVMLAYWTRKDADRMDRLFRQSALMRDKWDEQRGEKTYGALTISKAIELQENTYTPGTPRETPTEPDGLMDGQWDELEGEGQVTTPTRETIKTWALTDLLSTEFPEPEWVVPDLLPTGEAILAGRPKLGKSFLALQLALALGAGARFLDRPLVKGRCLYIALEDSPKRLQRRLRGMKAEAIEGLDFAFRWPALNEPAGIDALATAIHRDGLRLVVIDTIARAIRGRLDWDDIAQVTAMLGQLQELAMATDCCILLIDHHRKGNGQGGADAVDDVMGSTGKSAVADTIWGLYRKRGERTATLAVTGRDVEEETLALSFDHLTLTWQAERDGSGKPKIESVQGRILRLIEDWGEATTTDLADALGMTRPHVSNELAELLSRGAVVRGARVGRVVPYTLPEPHRESVNDVNSMNRVNRVNGESSDNTDDSYYSHDSHHNGGAHMPDLVAAMTLSGARQPGDPF